MSVEITVIKKASQGNIKGAKICIYSTCVRNLTQSYPDHRVSESVNSVTEPNLRFVNQNSLSIEKIQLKITNRSQVILLNSQKKKLSL